tara:strand:+ start:1086 stop:1241 length:156 start_codon:yes stop_codon:yes gene_type:complete
MNTLGSIAVFLFGCFLIGPFADIDNTIVHIIGWFLIVSGGVSTLIYLNLKK